MDSKKLAKLNYLRKFILYNIEKYEKLKRKGRILTKFEKGKLLAYIQIYEYLYFDEYEKDKFIINSII